jgi:hypothetical protein
MRIKQITEASPMGFFKGLGKTAMSKVSNKAAGSLETGKFANHLKNQFELYLGQSNLTPTMSALTQWLQKIGYPMTSAEQVIKKYPQYSGTTPSTTSATTPATSAPTTTPSPEQIRQQKQAIAAKAAQAQMTPKPAASTTPSVPLSPEQIRQQKQAIAAKAAQAQMTPKPVSEDINKILPDNVINDVLNAVASDFVSGGYQLNSKTTSSQTPANIQTKKPKIKMTPNIRAAVEAYRNMSDTEKNAFLSLFPR